MLAYSHPEEQGVSSSCLLNFLELAEQKLDSLHSLMLVRHGKVVAEGWWAPYSSDTPHMLFSLSKSFTSTAIGMAVAEGRLTVDDPVLGFFPEEAPADAGENLKAMRVRHLLSMSTGHHVDTMPALHSAADGNWVKAFFSVPVQHEPGSYFLYNTGATYMLSAILQKLTGMTLLDYLTPRLFEPLGIVNPTWEQCPRGINTGGFGLSVRTVDIASFGQLFLQQGLWMGKRLIPQAWVAEATRKHVDNNNTQTNIDWIQGYGYQFWRCQHNFYRGDGAHGQYCIVMAEQDAVLAITAGVNDMQAVLTLVWDALLPALQPGVLQADPGAEAALRRKLKSLALTPVAGQSHSPLESALSGRRFKLDANDLQLETVSFAFDPAARTCTLGLQDKRGAHSVTCGYASWLQSASTLEPTGKTMVAASWAWTGDDTLTAQICFRETPFIYSFACRVAGNMLQLTFTPNISNGPGAGKQTSVTARASE